MVVISHMLKAMAIYTLENIDKGTWTKHCQKKLDGKYKKMLHAVLNGQNTEKNPGDLWRFALTQTPVKDHQLTLT